MSGPCAKPADGEFRIWRQAHRRYDPGMRQTLTFDSTLLKPGMRIAVGLSGGADSVALLRVVHGLAAELGLVVHAAHLHHGLRGDEADGDLEFCRALAAGLAVEFHEARVDTASEAKSKSESIEEAARRLRYAWFRELMAKGELDAVATAHSLDDQAETVLGKFLRGAWTEGLSGIHPVLEFAEGRIVRPLLGTRRAEIDAYLNELSQEWREDSSNRDLVHTRNRIRYELLPALEGWNPRLREHLTGMATLARTEEAWWKAEVEKIAPQLLLAGKPVRGGGRAATEAGIAIDWTRLAALHPAMQRRLLRSAAEKLGFAPGFAATEALRAMALTGRAGQKLELEHGLLAERTPRELRLGFQDNVLLKKMRPEKIQDGGNETPLEYRFTIPGEVVADGFGIRLWMEYDGMWNSRAGNGKSAEAVLRNWRAGDRVRLRYSSGPRKVKEVLERLRVTGSRRTVWPVLEVDGRIVWMQGVELEPERGLVISASAIEK